MAETNFGQQNLAEIILAKSLVRIILAASSATRGMICIRDGSAWANRRAPGPITALKEICALFLCWTFSSELDFPFSNRLFLFGLGM